LEGLEISIVSLASVLSSSYSQRIDSTFFLKEFLNAPVYTNSLPLKEICIIRSGTTPSERDENLKSGVILLKTGNIRNGVLGSSTGSNFFYIDPKTDDAMSKTHLESGDVLMNIVGATTDVIGRCSILEKNFPSANITQAMALLRLKSDYKSRFKSKFIFAYLVSYFGHQQVRKIARPTGQFNMNLEEVGSFSIPTFSLECQSKICDLIDAMEDLNTKSISAYSKAETLLIDALGLLNFTLNSDPVNIKLFSTSFMTSGRIDAEYYQPKYEQMVEHIQSQAHAKLGDLVNIQKSIEPGSEAYADDANGLSFLRVADYSKQGLTKPQICLNEKFVTENADKINSLKPKKDTILFSKDGSVGEAYRLREDADFITSGAILHLTVKDATKLLPDYLTLTLNSIVVKQQAERDAGGSIILHWRKEEIENVLVPIIDMSIQKKITIQVQESFKLKAESERLLEVAKRAVEIAIEQDEAAGMRYIEQNLT
jgi:type I restriction enzyme, S subunit